MPTLPNEGWAILMILIAIVSLFLIIQIFIVYALITAPKYDSFGNPIKDDKPQNN